MMLGVAAWVEWQLLQRLCLQRHQRIPEISGTLPPPLLPVTAAPRQVSSAIPRDTGGAGMLLSSYVSRILPWVQEETNNGI